MTMTIRCGDCGIGFDVIIPDKSSHDFPCPACGKVEVFGLGAWERKEAARNEKLIRKSGRDR